MKALRYLGPGQLAVQEVPDPVMSDNDVLVKVMACGICGSDVHGYLGLTGRRTEPMTMGHEFSGQIVKTGTLVTSFKEGDKVIVQPMNFCGTCVNCLQGNTNMCLNSKLFGVMAVDGAMAEYLAVPEKLLFKLPEACSYEVGAMTEPFAVAHGAVKKVGSLTGKTVLIVGMGTIGQCLLQLVKLQSPKLIIVSDLSDNRLKIARELGADAAINPGKENYLEAVKRLTGGDMVDVSIEAVGIGVTVNQAIKSLKRMGTALWVGNSAREIEIDMQEIVTSALKIVGTYIYTHTEFGEVIDIMGTGNPSAEKLVSKVVSLDEAPDAFRMLHEQPDSFIKIIINPAR
ncbi:MAG: galactitol-1-phosphate 5-dehydrogenase [Dehalococcoidales bacterium]|nr:galactitol-1-phosphate 5-dehydrogenase [Dehalococcoidales bacterium]